jgi:hypothetical protein
MVSAADNTVAAIAEPRVHACRAIVADSIAESERLDNFRLAAAQRPEP